MKKYELIKKVGEGSFGEAFSVRHFESNEIFLLK